MTLQALVLLFLNVLANAGGQLAFKAGALAENHHNGLHYYLHIIKNTWILCGVACFILEFFIWLSFLTLVPLSNGVLLGSLNIAILLIASRFCFNERITPYKLAGIILVTMGVVLVGVNT